MARVRLAIVDGLDVRDGRFHNYPPRWNGAPSQELLVRRAPPNAHPGFRSDTALRSFGAIAARRTYCSAGRRAGGALWSFAERLERAVADRA